ncbi:MAG: hypothetical protein ACRCR9_05725 [Chitinophagaceae bacterium]
MNRLSSNLMLFVFMLGGGIFEVLQSQTVDSKQSGDFRSCFTWTDQSRIGHDEVRILGPHTIEVNNHHRTYNAIVLSSPNTVLQLNSLNGIDISDLKGSINMDFCRTEYELKDFDNTVCIQLWRGYEELPSTWSMPTINVKVNRYHTTFLPIVKIEKAGYYTLNSIQIIPTLPNGPDGPYFTCWASRFMIEATLVKNKDIYSPLLAKMVIHNYSTSVITSVPLPNCNIPGAPAWKTRTEANRYHLPGAERLGYLNVGDEISLFIQVYTRIPPPLPVELPNPTNCDVGSMRVMAVFKISPS